MLSISDGSLSSLDTNRSSCQEGADYGYYVITNDFELKTFLHNLPNSPDIKKIDQILYCIGDLDNIENRALSFYYFQKALTDKYSFEHYHEVIGYINDAVSFFVSSLFFCISDCDGNIKDNNFLQKISSILKNDEVIINQILDLPSANDKIKTLGFYLYFFTNNSDIKSRIKSMIIDSISFDFYFGNFKELSIATQEAVFNESKEQFASKYL